MWPSAHTHPRRRWRQPILGETVKAPSRSDFERVSWRPGKIEHDSLVALLATLTDSAERNWVTGCITEHVALDAAQAANRTSEELKSIGSPFLSAPRTEAQLYEQVIARFEDIRKNLRRRAFQ
jgi:hypothetical protein